MRDLKGDRPQRADRSPAGRDPPP